MLFVTYTCRMADLDEPNNTCHFNDGKDLRLGIKYMKEIGKVTKAMKQCFVATCLHCQHTCSMYKRHNFGITIEFSK